MIKNLRKQLKKPIFWRTALLFGFILFLGQFFLLRYIFEPVEKVYAIERAAK